jgi:CHAT domain-containing protein/Tfp pilus assembly protein PilF
MSSLRDPWWTARAALLTGALLGLASCSRGGLKPSPGVVVESLGPQGVGARAGLHAGDVLLSWHRLAAPPANPGEAEGNLASCSDVAEVESEEAPRGPVEIRVQRGGAVSTVPMPAGEWQLGVRPRVAAGPEVSACAAYTRASQAARESHWAEALSGYTTAADWARASRRPRFAAIVLQQRGVAHFGRDEFAQEESDLRESLRLLSTAAPGSLENAAAWHLLGRMAWRQGDYTRADENLRKGFALRSRLAPDSLELASSFNNLGIVAMTQGDLARARPFYLQALNLTHRRAPGSLDEAYVLNNLGLVSRGLGDSATAMTYLVQANHIFQRVDPGGQSLIRNLTNLGALAADRGDLALAEEYEQAALQHYEATAPEGLEVANLLTNLGMIARDRFAFDEAETLFRRALAIQRKRSPGSLDEALSLSNIAWVLQESGRIGEAEDCGRRALAIRSRLSPGSTDVATSLSILGSIALRRKDYRTAVSLGEQALALQRRIAPGTTLEGDLLGFLGSVALQANHAAEAERYGRRELAIRRRLTPQTCSEAEALYLVAGALQKKGRMGEAEDFLRLALSAVEAQVGRLGGSADAQSDFEARWAEIYQHLIALQIERGEETAAFQTLERWRARGLLAQIAERDLTFSADIPAPLLARQQALDRAYEKTQVELAQTDPRHQAEIEGHLVQLSRLRNQRASLEDSIVHASPRYASLRHPQPLDLAAARGALDPGTVWLSYFVDVNQTVLFVVTPAANGDPEGLRVFRLAAGETALADEAAVFRGLILRGRDEKKVEPALLVEGRKLYNLLIAPAAPWIDRAGRILISPDGPLHTLPFAALVRPGPRPQWLVEWKPVHTALSATLYAQLKAGRRRDTGAGGGAGTGTLVALADPMYRPVPGATADANDPPLRRYRAGLPSLPGAHEEVAALSSLYGRDARVYTGAAATKAQVEHLPPGTRCLHFACHALLDRRFPLDSALALAASPASPASPAAEGDDNGMLQAWEIFERLRIDADLVTLSACSTGLGRDAGGEGLIGLTRAFQYAGARSVLASLWAVSDRSTAALMARFYTRLRAGSPKDVALAEAQRELLHDGQLSHPYSWAAFELNGDWR